MTGPGEATALPWRSYVDPDAHPHEVEACWRGAWHYVGTDADLDEPGSQRACLALDVPVLLVRDASADDRDRPGGLRAFVNACRHRGARLVEGAACARSIRCPYHGWTYALDGSLRAAPLLEAETGVAVAERSQAWSLHELRLQRWGPMLFVALDDDAPALTEWLGPIPERVAQLGIDVEQLAVRHHGEGEVACNWKVACENYLECYHCRIAHRDFCAVIDVEPGAYELASSGRVATQVTPRREQLEGRGEAFAADGPIERGEFWFVFPNLVAYVTPGEPVLAVGPVVPRGVDRTWRSLDYLAAPGLDEAYLEQLVAWDDRVGDEDRALVEAVQAGMHAAPVIERGAAVMPRSEQLVAWFAERVRDAVG